MSDLIAFLSARLEEDEQIARDAGGCGWMLNVYRRRDPGFVLDQTWRDTEHIVRHDPARVLREVEAKRRRLALYLDAKETLAAALEKAPPEDDPATAHSYVRERINVNQASGRFAALEMSVRLDAMAWSDHADYRPEWKAPEG